MSKKDTEKKPTDEALATLMLDRQERVERCGAALGELLKKERCVLKVSAMFFGDDGKVQPQIQLMALD